MILSSIEALESIHIAIPSELPTSTNKLMIQLKNMLNPTTLNSKSQVLLILGYTLDLPPTQ